jgi:hypothetical protein
MRGTPPPGTLSRERPRPLSRLRFQGNGEQIERKSGRLESSSALNEINDEDNDGNYEQEVDQAAANVADKAKKPENDQDDNYSPEHEYSFRLNQTFVGLFI